MTNLNTEQQLAASHINGPCIVVAIPGSGKTACLTERVSNLLKNHIKPNNILCLTFTNKAANEMKERLLKKVGDSSSAIWVSTFHKLFIAILRKYSNKTTISPNFSIYDENDQKDLIEKITRLKNIDSDKNLIYYLVKCANDYRENLLDNFDEFNIKDCHIDIIESYYKTLDKLNVVDFSGILYKTYLLLKENPDVQQELADRFKYVLVDEWQDTNKIQYEITKKIASHGNIFVVGDECQSIFGFRGSKPENMNLIKQDFNNVKEIVFVNNYRSSEEILKVAQKLIKNNPNTDHINLQSVRGKGDVVDVIPFDNPEHEAGFIACEIDNAKFKKKLKWNDFAILYRINSLSRNLEMSLKQKGIPYKVYGGFSFFDRKEIKTVISYLSFLSNPSDTISFVKSISTPTRGVGDVAIAKIEQIAHDNNCSIFQACKMAIENKELSKTAMNSLSTFIKCFEKHKQIETDGSMNLFDMISSLVKETGLYEYMKKQSDKDPDWQKRIDNVNEFLKSIEDYQNSSKSPNLSSFLQTIQLYSSADEEEKDCVSLMTIHAAKGLEFKYVFGVGLEQGILPHKKSIEENNIFEERRLLYVLASRAKDKLFLSYCKNRKVMNVYNSGANKNITTKPSMFLSEIY